MQTPSLVPPHLLELILSALQQQYGIAQTAEISLEADPGTFDLQRLLQYKALGVTRISMGVQSFQEVGEGCYWCVGSCKQQCLRLCTATAAQAAMLQLVSILPQYVRLKCMLYSIHSSRCKV